MVATETGKLRGRFPYARVGSGPRTLVVFPGLDDAMFDGTYPPGAGAAFWWYFSRYVDTHTVYVVSRPRGLPEGHAIGDMAAEYAAVLAEDLGPGDVLGVSMGGLIALELAIRRSDLVERLVLANSGCRIADLEVVRRFRRYARERDWSSIRAELSAAMFSDLRAVTYPPLARTLGRFVLPKPAVPSDVAVSLDAIEAYDATDRLGDVAAPTLVFGGADDPYFPESILRRTADGIPDSELDLVRGGKHGAFHERKWRFDGRATAFLERRARTVG